MRVGWLGWLRWSSGGTAGGAGFSPLLLPLHDRAASLSSTAASSGSATASAATAAIVAHPSSIPLRRPAAFAAPPFHSSFPSSSVRRPLMSATARSTAALLLCCGLLLLLLVGWAAVGPSVASGGSTGWSAVLPFSYFPFSAAAGVAHDDVSLSASFALSCPSAADCPFYGGRHLVVVAGHAVLTSLDYHNLTDDSQWALQSFQRSQLSTFIAHIERGVAIAAADPTAVLLFSGGETRPSAGPRSEAQSYWMVAELSGWWQHSSDMDTAGGQRLWSVRSRTSTEEFARDSYENLLFSLCRFHELTQRYPDTVTLVGFSFKKARFVQLHAHAIRYPPSRLVYVGVDPSSPQ